MLIIITGKRGSGKSVVCRKIIDLARKRIGKCGGVLTYYVSNNSLVVEDIITMKQIVLAGAPHTYTGPHLENYSYNPRGIAFKLAAIEKAAGLPMILIDELSFLELKEKNCAAVLNLLSKPTSQVQIAAVNNDLLPSFLPMLNTPDRIYVTTVNTRNMLPARIVDYITGGRSANKK